MRNEMKARGTLLMSLPNKDQLKFHSYKNAKLLMEAIEKRNKQEIETISLDDLYNNLKIYEPEISGSSSTSQNPQNVAFVSSNSTNSNSSTNEADNTAYGFSVAHTQSNPTSGDNLKKMDLQWEMAMLTIRARRFIKRIECKAPRNQENRERKINRRTMTVETPTENALVAQDRIGGSDSELVEESINVLKLEVKLRDTALVENKKKLEKAKKERDELKLTLEKFQNSSKSLNNLLESQVIEKLKTGLVYNAASSTAASPVVESFVNSSGMLENQENNKSKSDKGYHAVPPPFTRNFMPRKPNLTFMDEIVKSENLDVTTVVTPSNVKTVDSNLESASVKNNGNVVEPKTVRKNSFRLSVIEDWNSGDKSEVEIIPKDKTVSSSTEKMKIVNTARETVDKIETSKQNKHNPKGNQRNWNNQTFVTDDFSRFSWVFFLATKDETSGILKTFITEIENQLDHKVKVIRCDNGTEFKNSVMNQFCEMKGIKREFSVARTPQQNGVAERRNRTLIEAARTMLVDSKLPTTFWAEAVNTACYVLNRVLVIKPHNKTPYELIRGRTPLIDFMKPFGCPITILNTKDQLGKLDGKADEGFFVGYSVVSKAMRVFNKRTRIVKETLNIRFLENAPNVTGNGPDWLFDVDSLSKSMNYVPVIAENQTNGIAGKRDNIVAGQAEKKIEPEQEYILIPICTTDPLISQDPKVSEEDAEEKTTEMDESGASDKDGEDDQATRSEFERLLQQENHTIHTNSTNSTSTVSTPVSTAGPSCTDDDLSSPVNAAEASNAFEEHLFEQFSPFKNAFTLPPVSNVTLMNDTRIFGNAYDDEDMGQRLT
ncbi:putative ribonuclease H-like domain-containing protein [Tanacetum coccineum]